MQHHMKRAAVAQAQGVRSPRTNLPRRLERAADAKIGQHTTGRPPTEQDLAMYESLIERMDAGQTLDLQAPAPKPAVWEDRRLQHDSRVQTLASLGLERKDRVKDSDELMRKVISIPRDFMHVRSRKRSALGKAFRPPSPSRPWAQRRQAPAPPQEELLKLVQPGWLVRIKEKAGKDSATAALTQAEAAKEKRSKSPRLTNRRGPGISIRPDVQFFSKRLGSQGERKAAIREIGRVKSLGSSRTGTDWLIEFDDGSLIWVNPQDLDNLGEPKPSAGEGAGAGSGRAGGRTPRKAGAVAAVAAVTARSAARPKGRSRQNSISASSAFTARVGMGMTAASAHAAENQGVRPPAAVEQASKQEPSPLSIGDSTPSPSLPPPSALSATGATGDGVDAGKRGPRAKATFVVAGESGRQNTTTGATPAVTSPPPSPQGSSELELKRKQRLKRRGTQHYMDKSTSLSLRRLRTNTLPGTPLMNPWSNEEQQEREKAATERAAARERKLRLEQEQRAGQLAQDRPDSANSD